MIGLALFATTITGSFSNTHHHYSYPQKLDEGMEGTKVNLSPSHVNCQIRDPHQDFTLLHIIGESGWLCSLGIEYSYYYILSDSRF